MGKYFVFPAALILFMSFSVSAKEKVAKNSRTFSLFFENDMFAETDFLYTNGIKFSLISPDLSNYRGNSSIPEWSYPLIEKLTPTVSPEFQKSAVLAIGQNIYTPENTELSNLIIDDRPYAGILYLSAGLHIKSKKKMSTVEFVLGILGSSSLAEEVQKFIHEIGGIGWPQGWDHQLKDEPVLGINFDRRWRFLRFDSESNFGFDVIPNIGVGLGNAFILVYTGGLLRVGWNLPNDFGTSVIRPGSDTNAPVDEGDPRFFRPFHRLGFHVFMGLDVVYQIHNTTLDGNNYHTSHSVEKMPFFANFIAGFGAIIYRFKITYSYVFQTKQFKTQKVGQNYGSVTFSFSF